MINKLFFILTLILIIPDIYIYRMFIIRSTDSTLLKVLYFLPSLFLLIGLIWIVCFADQRFTIDKNYCLGWFIITFMAFALPKLIFFVCSIFDLPLKYIAKWSFMPFSWLGVIIASICLIGILYGSIIGKTKFNVKDIAFHSPNIPQSFNGYKIIQLSDIHIGSWTNNEKELERAVQLINAQKPDLIVFTGDLVNHRATELNGFEDILSKMKAKDGVFSILGNHDYGPYYHWNSQREKSDNLAELEQRETNMGWQLLNNEHIYLHQGNDSIALIGVENWGIPPFNGKGDLQKAMQGVNDGFKILLSHNPTHWEAEVLSKTDIELMLAGHTHAMQFAIGQYSPSSWVYKEWKGMYTKGKQNLYVNVGLGFIGMPFRFGAWPEITVITLKKENS